MNPSSSPFRIAVVGCGAVSRASLLPVLAGHDGVRVGPLIDRDKQRARDLADEYNVQTVMTDIDGLSKDIVDGVILATPPAHHAAAAIALAQKGLHVLVEKPMAITAGDAEAMVQAADAAGVALSVGLYRRFLPSVQLLKTLIERGEFGRPLRVDAEEGGPYGWPLATLDVLRRATGGGGPLIDLGSHVIDLVLYVLQAAPSLDSYSDNERGGIETDCVLQATLATASGSIPLRLEMSRTRELRNSIKVECEQATIELPRASFTEVLVHRHSPHSAGSDVKFSASWKTGGNFVGYEAFRREIDDWINGARQKTDPILSGRSVVPVVRLIEGAYRARTPLVEPGDTPVVDTPRPSPAVARKRVLVTGAGGFLGGRAVELLRDQYGWDAVALVRSPKSAAQLARWPHDILIGDICSREDMDRVLRGCDAVVHCAVGTSWKADETRHVTVEGTRIVAEAALAAGVKRFVHISTLFVHQRDGVSTIDENSPLNPPAQDAYGQSKLAAEQALAAIAAKGLQTIVLRPSRIYGPFSKTFTVRPLGAMTEGRLAVGGNPDVPGNMVYVDNVVGAIASALEAPSSLAGSAYLVTDAEQVSLREFYEFFGRPTGHKPVLLPDAKQRGGASPAGHLSRFVSGVTTIAKSPEFRGIVRRVLETDPIGTIPRRLWDRSPKLQRQLLSRFGSNAAVVYRPAAAKADMLIYFGEPTLVSGGKALRELGAQPVSASDAMARTLVWARYARLLPTPD
ncbi:MAG: NAD-dependent epimerase/dehydratase family protein [Vicinamibacterales bacterium]